jgi:hypothetical protein
VTNCFWANKRRDDKRFTSEYTSGDAVATAMQNVVKHVPASGDPEKNFEALIGAFGGQSDVLEDLATLPI